MKKSERGQWRAVEGKDFHFCNESDVVIYRDLDCDWHAMTWKELGVLVQQVNALWEKRPALIGR